MRSGPWTTEEIGFLRTYYPVRGAAYCAQRLGRKTATVYTKASQLEIRSLDKGAPWTEEDVRVLERDYPAKGAVYVANALDRTPRAVALKARKLGVQRGETAAIRGGQAMLLRDVAAMSGMTYGAVHKRAKRDRVLRGKERKQVPARWGRDYIAEKAEANGNEERYAHYLTTPELCDYLGITRRVLTRAREGKSSHVTELLQDVHVVRGRHSRLRFGPPQLIEAARDALAAERAAVAGMVPLKSIWIDADVHPGTAYHHASTGQMKVFPHRGKRSVFVSPADAARLRERLS